MRELALFAGGGGSLLAGKILGWVPVCAVELDAYCRRILLARQRDGLLPRFPVWDNVCTFDGKPWRGHIDIITGGFPCQDISVAGGGEGITGPRSGLWAEFARIIGEVRPRYAFIENTAALATRGLSRVLADLAALGMDARWCCLGADDVGAPHIRKRLWILATDAQRGQLRQQSGRGAGPRRCHTGEPREHGAASDLADAQRPEWGTNTLACRAEGPQLLPQGHERAAGPRAGCKNMGYANGAWEHESQRQWSQEWRRLTDTGWWEVEPPVGRVVDELADRLDQLRALGNGWVPQCAVAAWHILHTGVEEDTP